MGPRNRKYFDYRHLPLDDCLVIGKERRISKFIVDLKKHDFN
jgi:hypothetical protein